MNESVFTADEFPPGIVTTATRMTVTDHASRDILSPLSPSRTTHVSGLDPK